MTAPSPVVLPIRFFKPILNSNVQKLKIPNKFTNRYGGMLLNPVFLRPPDGTQWEVLWTKQNGEIWFEKGWKEFVENYSLDHGHFVFFTFEGTSKIDVLIIHEGSLDIQYPSSHTPEQSESLDYSDDEGPDSDHNAEYADDEGSERTLSLNWPKDLRARKLACKFISCNPFFTVVIRSYHLTEYRLNLPNMKGYIDKRKKYVTMKVEGRSWSVKLVGDGKRIGAGWQLFSKENDLEEEDVCIFELICRNDSVFKVHIFKRQT